MRILMLAQFYSPIVGGEETYVRNLSTALVQQNHDVAVATLWHPGLPAFEIQDGVRIYRLRGSVERLSGLFTESNRRHHPPLPDPEVVLSLREVIKHEKPDIVHAHNWIVYSFFPLKAWSKAKLVMSLHDYGLICAKQSLVYREAPCTGPGLKKCMECSHDHYGLKGIPTLAANWAMGRQEKAAVDLFLPVSDAVAIHDGIAGSGLPYRVVSNFLLDDAYTLGASDDPRLADLPKEDFLLFVGDLRKFKGIELLLEAYTKLSSPPPLVLIGRHTRETPAELPPNVIAPGIWPRDAIKQAWSRSLFGLAPSIGLETFGLVVLEAMALGRPVVASRIGGIPEIIVDGETGFLVQPGNVEALKSAMSRLLAEPELRERMGKASADRAQMFRTSVIVPHIESLYQKLLNNSLEVQTDFEVIRA